jgi:hypothetical protein
MDPGRNVAHRLRQQLFGKTSRLTRRTSTASGSTAARSTTSSSAASSTRRGPLVCRRGRERSSGSVCRRTRPSSSWGDLGRASPEAQPLTTCVGSTPSLGCFGWRRKPRGVNRCSVLLPWVARKLLSLDEPLDVVDQQRLADRHRLVGDANSLASLMPEDEFVYRHLQATASRAVRTYEPVPSNFLSQARMRAITASSLRRRSSRPPSRRALTPSLTEKSGGF